VQLAAIRDRCRLLAQSGHTEMSVILSAFGGKADIEPTSPNVCF
jgi:hypothetical protein